MWIAIVIAVILAAWSGLGLILASSWFACEDPLIWAKADATGEPVPKSVMILSRTPGWVIAVLGGPSVWVIILLWLITSLPTIFNSRREA